MEHDTGKVVPKKARFPRSILLIGLMILIFFGYTMKVGFRVNSVEENPRVMQLAYCDDIGLKLIDYKKINRYSNKEVVAGEAYFASWELDPASSCKKISITNAKGLLLWEENSEGRVLKGKLVMMRTIRPHTISVRLLHEPE